MKSIYFKRLALVVVAALGMGLLSTGPTSAAVTDETFTVSASTATAFVGDSATITAAIAFTSGSSAAAEDSRSITSTVTGPAAGGSVNVYFKPTSDSIAATTNRGTYAAGTTKDINNYFGVTTDTVTTSTNNGYVKQTFSVVMYNFTAVGTYYVTLRSQGAPKCETTAGTNTCGSGNAQVFKTSLITVTVTERDNVITGVNSYVSADTYTSLTNRLAFRASSDSAIVVDKGSAATPVAVGMAAFTVKNAAGETMTASSTGPANKSGGTRLKDTLTVTVSGPGLIWNGNEATSKAKAATIIAYNNTAFEAISSATHPGETLTIYSDGTAGVSTITVSNGVGVVMTSFTVTFTGSPASVSQLWLSDTIAQIGQLIQLWLL